jgi:hypothetical protein
MTGEQATKPSQDTEARYRAAASQFDYFMLTIAMAALAFAVKGGEWGGKDSPVLVTAWVLLGAAIVAGAARVYATIDRLRYVAILQQSREQLREYRKAEGFYANSGQAFDDLGRRMSPQDIGEAQGRDEEKMERAEEALQRQDQQAHVAQRLRDVLSLLGMAALAVARFGAL